MSLLEEINISFKRQKAGLSSCDKELRVDSTVVA